jgi:hypothetical protein
VLAVERNRYARQILINEQCIKRDMMISILIRRQMNWKLTFALYITMTEMNKSADKDELVKERDY